MAQKLEWLLRGSRAAVSFSTEWPQEFGISQSSSWGDSSGRQAMAAIWGSFTVSLPPGAPSRSCPPSWELPEPGPREGPGLRVRTLGLVDRLQLETASVCPPEGRWSSRGSSLSSGALPGALQAALGAPLTTGGPSLITRAGLGSQSSCSDSAARSLALGGGRSHSPVPIAFLMGPLAQPVILGSSSGWRWPGPRTGHGLAGRPPPSGGERAFTLSYVFKEHPALEMTPR